MGEVLSANVALCNMFGYSKTELEGRNVSTLIPPPWSDHHDAWVAAFASGTRQVSHTVNYTRRLFGLHRNGTVFPLALTIKQVTGGLQGSVFLAMVTPERVSEHDHFLVVDTAAGGVVLKSSAGALPLLGRFNSHDDI